MILAIFDFDGTITTKDSLADFIQYAIGKPGYYFGLVVLSPILIAYKLKLIPNYLAKEKLISYFFKGWSDLDFQTISDKYSLKRMNRIIRENALKKIKWHQKQGHEVVIVSASMENWLKKWCDYHKVALIATRLEVQNGQITGKLATKNCHGIEKVNRLNEWCKLSEYSEIYAYGNSSGDKEMLSIADKAYYKYFNN